MPVNSNGDEQTGFHVVVTGQENDGRRYEIGSDGLLIGRSETCDVVFQDREVSRRHAYFYTDAGVCWVEDLGSRNGTLVNGERIERLRLSRGDVVSIGPSRFLLGSSDGTGRLSRRLWFGRPARDVSEERAAPRGAVGPLAAAALVFGLTAYLHWVLGLCAVVLASLAFADMRQRAGRLRRSFLLCGIFIGVLGAASNVWFGRVVPRRQQSHQARQLEVCRTNLLHLGDAIAAYRADNGGRYPRDLDLLVQGGYCVVERLHCPAWKSRTGGGARYLYTPPASRIEQRPGSVIVTEPEPNCPGGRGGWVLRGDGRLQLQPPERLRQLLREAAEVGQRPLPGGG